VVAVVAGGIAGVLCFIGLTLLLHRRLSDPRIRLTSHRTDIAILIILWVQLVHRPDHAALLFRAQRTPA
jgi:nitrate reductase gamma subunit